MVSNNVDNGFRQTSSNSINNKPRIGSVDCDEIPGILKVALVASDSAGGILSVANPLGATLLIKRVLINLTTKSTIASTVDVGVAANGTTLSETLLDEIDCGSAAALFDNADVTDQGTAGKASRLWSSTEYITASKATGACAGLAGYAYIEFVRV